MFEGGDDANVPWQLEGIAPASFAQDENSKFRAVTLRKDGTQISFIGGIDRLGQYYAV